MTWIPAILQEITSSGRRLTERWTPLHYRATHVNLQQHASSYDFCSETWGTLVDVRVHWGHSPPPLVQVFSFSCSFQQYITSNNRPFGCPITSSAQTFIHNSILFIDVSNNACYNKVHWLIKTPYLSVIARNDCATWVKEDDTFRSATEHFFVEWTHYFTHDPFIVLSLNRDMFPRLVRHSRSHS